MGIENARTFDLGYGYHFTVTTTDSFQTFCLLSLRFLGFPELVPTEDRQQIFH